ncbi:BatD family protein [Legionella brunensis]|uniref:KQDN repeat-containing protein n=1 Tax=Legionella brunensis TaxID=29422 RepID=A0A0W0S1D6_9GAMM|nr:BatD family protein [Legionella brunensis]KTC76980.1 KQDN repeat-containing protein [Legionella brunensis]
MKKILLSLFLLGFYSLGFATVTMRLETSTVQAGETFQLILILEGSQTDSIPDLTPLQKDFTIVGTERSVNYTLVNGRASSVGQWLVLLIPKRTGVLNIPAIQVGQEKTMPGSIEVTEQASESKEPDTDKQQDVKLVTEVSVENPYINQQVIYTVKLYYSGRLMNANYQPPQVEDALLIPLGAGRRYQTAENGRLYRVEEQQYALFPQKSGDLKIIPPSFQTIIYDAVPKHVNERAQATLLHVKPIPEQHANNNWLPAKQVNLTETYDNNASSLQQGSTIVRSVTLQATAVPAQLLPVLDFGSSTDFSVYPEKRTERNTFQQPDLVGTTTVKVTYLLNKTGQITIPPLKLTWFNTTTGKEEIATLPERSIQVMASANAPNPTVKPSTAVKETKPADIPQTVVKTEKTSDPRPTANSTKNFAWWLASGFAIAWLLTLSLWIWQRRNRSSIPDTKQVVKRLQEACSTNNASAARDALVQWAQRQWPQATILNLMDIESRVSDASLKQQIKELSHALYHNGSQNLWHGADLWACFTAFKEGKSPIHSTNSLPPMHKL